MIVTQRTIAPTGELLAKLAVTLLLGVFLVALTCGLVVARTSDDAAQAVADTVWPDSSQTVALAGLGRQRNQ